MKRTINILKGILVSCLVFLTAGNSYGSAITASGTIGANTTWNTDTVKVAGDITIPSGITLTINSGTVVRFMGYYGITDSGELNATGSMGDTILFGLSINDTGSFWKTTISTGGWSGIRIYGSCEFMYCKFQFAKKIVPGCPNDCGGAIFVKSNLASIKKCHFYKNYAINGGGINISADITLKECLIDYNVAKYNGGGINIGGNNVTLINNTITNNTASSGGGVGFSGGANVKFLNNIISFNKASDTYGGGGIYCNASIGFFQNNFITNNSCTGLVGSAYFINSYPSFINNVIANNSGTSAALYLISSDAMFINNTIYNNNAYGIYLFGTNMKSENNIFYGNKTYQIYINDQNSLVTIKYCDVQNDLSGIYTSGGTFLGTYENNISSIPLVVTPTADRLVTRNALNANWRLQATSPCINKGNPDTLLLDLPDKDIYAVKRIRNHVIDIGAAEKYIDVIYVSGNLTTDTTWFADTVKVTGDFTVNDPKTLTINPGTVVQMQGYYNFTVGGQIVAKGTKNDSIKFTCLPDSVSKGWQGLYLSSSSGVLKDSSFISHCIIEYANDSININGGGIYLSRITKLLISNSVFRYNRANYKGGAIFCEYSSPLIISNNICHNTAGRGGGICIDHSSPVIIGNILYRNQATESGMGGGIFEWFSDATISGNIISNNIGNGIEIFADNTRETYITNNLILANTLSGISINDIKFFAANNTIAGNQNIGMSLGFCRGTVINSLFRNDDIETWGDASIYISNCNLTNGASDISGTATIQNIYTFLPHFVNFKTDISSFTEAHGLSLLNTSLCINKGLNSYSYYSLPSLDLLGNNRIHDTIIDIGAIENQGEKPVFITQPVGRALCEGKSFTLSISTDNEANYQWQKDGVDISDSTGTIYTINSAVEDDEGNYVCVASNSFGETYSSSTYIRVKTAPEITDQPASMLVRKNDPLLLQVKIDGTRPMHFRWTINGIYYPDSTAKLFIDSFKLDNEGNYICEITNSCDTVRTDTAVLSLAPQICLITAKDSTANVVVFEKGSNITYSQYNIYREGIYSGVYEKLNSVNSSQPGIYTDYIDPREQANLYKITGVKTDGKETDITLCNIHKTMHLRVSKGVPSGYQLDWDEYIGFPYSTYYIFRSIDGGKSFDTVHVMSSSTTSWTDYTAPSGYLLYFVEVNKGDTCYPNGKTKAGSDIYSQSVSNLEDNRIRSSEISKTDIDEFNFSCYPNPVSELATIRYNINSKSHVVIALYNTLGSEIALLEDNKLGPGLYTYQLDARKLNLNSGVYILKFSAGSKSIERLLVITK